jgi:hypothetical protein
VRPPARFEAAIEIGEDHGDSLMGGVASRMIRIAALPSIYASRIAIY